MASVDILHPLAEDTIARTDVRVFVAYDLRSRKSKEKTVKLVCKMDGPDKPTLDTDVDPSKQGDHTFSFGTLTAGKYTVSAEALSTPDSEDPVYLVDSTAPVVTIDPPAVPPGDPLPTSGTLIGTAPELEVRIYGLVPGARSFWRFPLLLLRKISLSRSRSKKPFHEKFKHLSNWQPVASIGGGIWSQRVDWDSTHPFHLMVRAKMRVAEGRRQASRGSRRN